MESSTASCTSMLRRLSGPMVYGRLWGVRRRTASRCSRALLLADDADEGEEEDDAVAAVAIATGEDEVMWKRGGE